ncbi:MAPEG family protein [uncultured Shimia sp.]|uniref:MAPEG family protein n=1 Tax=uncultured Shimia sp. TaxID=573152 RepID=UPI0026168B2C|nr:MAPEG family protein [uncultured Shimia sp.]
MTETGLDPNRVRRVRRIIIVYPFALITAAIILNLLIGVMSAVPAVPTKPILIAFTISGLLLLANHVWLMTSTELTRLKYGLQATPEEWAKAGKVETEADPTGVREVKRHHDAHNNASENTLYFVVLAPAMMLISPTESLAFIWMVGFALGRLGHAYAYLSGKDGLRGIFMSVSLMSLFGMASYVALALLT